ncbi:hypothetical protein BV911_12730 [Pseudoruegeria sp. SK021]|nr:endonuclease/exonuclease/phosphatase family protein [Pseudoruegeria sp. SK021]OSP54458.1 hypothetical protein BV911_12730 [Pseudoruegeria sp. SK021]
MRLLGIIALWLTLGVVPSYGADPVRIATYTVELDRKRPGLLLRDILKGDDPQVLAAARIIARIHPDVILLTRFDYDLGGVALAAFADVLAQGGAHYPHRFAFRPNTGRASGLDLDGDGRLGGPADAQGFGWFAGQSGMAILSRYPLDHDRTRDFSGLLWQDLPGAILPQVAGVPFPSRRAQAEQRLSTTGHWDVPVLLPDGRRLNLLAFHATPPVFDGPEDRNGLRNRDEVRFWRVLWDGALPWLPPDPPFVLIGNANLDPTGGQGHRSEIVALLADPRIQDPMPQSAGAAIAGQRDPVIARTDTVAWDAEGEPGNMRVDYVLPSADLTVLDAGVFWPTPDDPDVALLGEGGRAASRGRLVWVDLEFP